MALFRARVLSSQEVVCIYHTQARNRQEVQPIKMLDRILLNLLEGDTREYLSASLVLLIFSLEAPLTGLHTE